MKGKEKRSHPPARSHNLCIHSALRALKPLEPLTIASESTLEEVEGAPRSGKKNFESMANTLHTTQHRGTRVAVPAGRPVAAGVVGMAKVRE